MTKKVIKVVGRCMSNSIVEKQTDRYGVSKHHILLVAEDMMYVGPLLDEIYEVEREVQNDGRDYGEHSYEIPPDCIRGFDIHMETIQPIKIDRSTKIEHQREFNGCRIEVLCTIECLENGRAYVSPTLVNILPEVYAYKQDYESSPMDDDW